MQLIEEFGERWARNSKNITDKHMYEKGKDRQGVYILYDGSTPVYIGKGNIPQRLRASAKHRRRKDSWDHFSWYVIKNERLRHDLEVLLIRMLPIYLRHLARQRGHFGRKGDRPQEIKDQNRTPDSISPPKFMRSSRQP
jgi:hypothetical protein